MAISDRLNKLTTDITNAYTSIENKGGTIPANKNTNNLSTAINSIEVIEQQTAEGESLNLANTKAMPYSDYVVKGKSEQDGEPSPSNPSEIHSVADDVNYFNIVNYQKDGWNAIIDNPLKGIGLSEGDYIISCENSYISSGYGFATVFCNEVNGNMVGGYFTGYNFGDGIKYNNTVTITSEQLNAKYMRFEAQDYLLTDDVLEYMKLQIKKGSTVKIYTPPNQGTVTIKQETIKNYLNWDKFIDYSNWSNAESDGYKSFEISGLDINKIYTLCRVDTAGYGEEFKYAGFNKGNNNGNMFLHSTDSSRNLQSVSDTPSEDGKIYITMYMSSQSDLNDYINIIKNCWIIEGSEYQNYISYRKIFQTEPLRSLPNGVKDTIEADGIHRKIGIQTGTLSQTTTITLSDAKQNGAYMCNIKPSGTLTGKTIELETGDYEIIYELAEEVIEPLTQNQATTMLDIIKTGSYEGTTNIYTDEDVKPTIGVGYYKKA